MCGFAGFLTTSPSTPESAGLAARMNDAITHRGPDDSGVWCDEAAGLVLAHRRLAILDLSPDGHQPMLSGSGRFVIAFNGEIYNFRALRDELAAVGHRFRGHSDTEVLLAAVEQWGVRSALERAAGMFAFALWDRSERTLHLSRDRLGEKPLYVGRFGGTVLFGSELKALRRHPAWHGEIDREALALYFRFGYVPGPSSIFKHVEKLRPGELLSIRATADALEERRERYWSLADARRRSLTDELPDDDRACEDALDAVLREVVGQQMVADVPLGAFLSGGIDSSMIVGVMQSLSSQPIRTFTIGFQEAAFDEAAYAREVARHLGTCHTELYVTPVEAMEVVPRLPTIFDEPFGDSSQIPTILVAQLARQHVTVSLSGDGGDELFAGYGHYVDLSRAWEKVARVPRSLRPALGRSMAGALPSVAHQVARRAGVARSLPNLDYRIERLAGMLSAPSPEGVYEQLVSKWHAPHHLVRHTVEPPHLPAAARDTSGASLVERAMLVDLGSYLPDDILVKVDRATMSASLESRAPFLDHRVVETAWRIPLTQKLRGTRGKDVLRRVLSRYVPRDLFERPKQGFGVPVGAWLRGPLREWAEELLSRERLEADGLLRSSPIRRRWKEHLEGNQDWTGQLWPVLMLQAWRER